MVKTQAIKAGAIKAAKAIVLQRNVAGAVATGQPELVGAAIGKNAVGYGLSHVKDLKIKGVNTKAIGAVGTRLNDAYNGKANIVNKGDVKIAAKVGAHMAANKYLKGQQRQMANGAINRVAAYDKSGGKTPLVNKGDVKIGVKYGAKKLLQKYGK